METKEQLKFLVFTIDGHKLALHLSDAERIIPAVEITPLSSAPSVIAGAVNVHGTIIPVADIRSRLKLPQRDLRLTDKIMLASTGSRKIGVLADDVLGVFEYGPEDIIPSGDIMPGMANMEGAVRLPDGIILIQDLKRFLSSEEERILDEAVSKL